MAMKYAVFPFQIPDHWDRITTLLSNITDWTPTVLTETIHTIHESSVSPDKPFNPGKYRKLFQFFEINTPFDGNSDELWGGHEFSEETFPQIAWWFMNHTLPHMAKLLLKLPQLFKEKVEISKSGGAHLTFTKEQCAALLAMMFFCANHYTCQLQPLEDYQHLPNFAYFLSSPSYTNKAKLFMLMNYFERTRLKIKTENFEIIRTKLPSGYTLKFWTKQAAPLCNFVVHDEGGITETSGGDVLHVDFANEYIGGGVLGGGAVQEEIMFSVCPELLVSLLFCRRMNDDETILLVNAEKFSAHSGYNMGLKFSGNFVDDTHTTRVAMDATCFGWGLGYNVQWKMTCILRELNKAACGFSNKLPLEGSPIATGNWGCGAFGGNIQLKSMLQWCAASLASRDIHYYTFSDENCEGLSEVVQQLIGAGVTVGRLIQAILNYADLKVAKTTKIYLFCFLLEAFSGPNKEALLSM